MNQLNAAEKHACLEFETSWINGVFGEESLAVDLLLQLLFDSVFANFGKTFQVRQSQGWPKDTSKSMSHVDAEDSQFLRSLRTIDQLCKKTQVLQENFLDFLDACSRRFQAVSSSSS